MATQSLKEIQFPGSADSYTFDASLFDGKTASLFAMKADLGSYVTKTSLTSTLADYVTNASLTSTLADYAKKADLPTGVAILADNQEFTGDNAFSGALSKKTADGSISIDTMRSFAIADPDGVSYGVSWLPIGAEGSNFYLAYSTEEGAENLSQYAKSSDLSGYAKTSDLSSYAKTSDLSAYAKLSANNAFTGSNSFSNAIAVDTINSKSTGNSIARMYYDTDKAYKVLLGSVARQCTLLGSTDRPYYAKNGEAFNAHALALSEDLGGYASLSGSNTFTGSNIFKMANRSVSIRDDNFCADDEDFIPFRLRPSGVSFGLKGANGTVYSLSDMKVEIENPNISSGKIYKINGENMCNYRKLTLSISMSGSGGGGGSGNAYGLYVNNVLVKIVGNFAVNVSGSPSVTVKISWDRSQPTDWNMLNHFMLTGISGSGNSTYTTTTNEFNLSVSLGMMSSGSRYFVVL